MKLVKFLWRIIAGLLRRAGALATKLSDRAYFRSLPGLSSEDRKLIGANAILRNRHIGQRCFVIGNGPSIGTQDLSFLADEVTLVMNAFWKHPVVESWQPTYFLLVDQVLFDRSTSVAEFYDNLNSRIRNSTYFVPLSQREVLIEQELLPLEQTHFLAVEDRLLDQNSQSSLDLTSSIPNVLTVAQFAIMAAIYMGCSPIYLLGLDHDWLSHQGEKGYYFFQGLSLNNHPQATGKPGPYDQEMEALLKVWNGYHRLKTLADNRNIRIINATAGGFLDVFERLPYQSLFEPAETRAHV